MITRPSNLHRTIGCPGWVRLREKYDVVEATNPAAALGTACHLVLEKWVNDSVPVDNWIGATLKIDDVEVLLTDEILDSVRFAIDYIEQSVLSRDTVKVIGERHLTTDMGYGGTCDVTIITYGLGGSGVVKLEVIDFKNGIMPVSIDDNPQLLSYAQLALHALAILDDNVLVTTTIIQPNSNDGIKISHQEYHGRDISDWWVSIAVPAITSDSETLNPSPKNCKYCPAMSHCTGVDKIFRRVLQMITDDNIDEVFILDNHKIIAEFADKVKSRVLNEILEGVVGYDTTHKVVKNPQKRSFIKDALDPDMSVLLDHLPASEFTRISPQTLGVVEKKIVARLGKMQAEEVMANITKKSDVSYKLVTVDEKGAAQRARESAKDVFKDEIEELK